MGMNSRKTHGAGKPAQMRDLPGDKEAAIWSIKPWAVRANKMQAVGCRMG